MKTEKIELNIKEGKGFAIYNLKIEDYVANKDGKIILFPNLESAKVFAFTRISKNSYDYRFTIFTQDLQIPLESVEYVDPYYEYYYSETGTWYLIEEDKGEQILSIGYFVFEDGDNPESENYYNAKKSGPIYHQILQVMGNLIENTTEEIPFVAEKFTKLSYGHVALKALSSSVRIHVLYNSEIVDQNMRRKEKGLRCIPFLKNMDKYKTFFIYISKNNFDSSKIEDKEIEDTMNYIVSGMRELGYECKYTPVEFHGFIRTTEGE